MQIRATGRRDETTGVERSAVKTRRARGINWSYSIGSWLGAAPFLLFCLLFEILPAIMVIQGSFVDSNTSVFTLNNYQRMLSQASNLRAFRTSIFLSVVTALIGAVIGFLAAWCVQSTCKLAAQSTDRLFEHR